MPGVTVFDSRAALCDRETCFAKKGNTYLYNADGNHLTPAGVEIVMDSFRQSTAWSAISAHLGGG